MFTGYGDTVAENCTCSTVTEKCWNLVFLAPTGCLSSDHVTFYDRTKHVFRQFSLLWCITSLKQHLMVNLSFKSALQIMLTVLQHHIPPFYVCINMQRCGNKKIADVIIIVLFICRKESVFMSLTGPPYAITLIAIMNAQRPTMLTAVQRWPLCHL